MLKGESAELSEAFSKLQIKLAECHKPLFIYDGDCDGVLSYLMLERLLGKNKAFLCPASLDSSLITAVNTQDHDMVIIMDIGFVSQDFINDLDGEIVVIDHHRPVDIKSSRLTYFNPQLFDTSDNRCTSYWSYMLTGEKYVWEAACGMVSDWQMPPFATEFRSQYPHWLPADINQLPEAMFATDIGKLGRMVNFNLKGNAKSVKKGIDALRTIKKPDQLFQGTTPEGSKLLKKYERVASEYHNLLEQVESRENGDDFALVFEYREANYSFSALLSNEVIYLHPDKKLYIVARETPDWYRCSLRSRVGTKIDLPLIIEHVSSQVRCNGGGHFNAAGCSIYPDDFAKFVELVVLEAKKMENKN